MSHDVFLVFVYLLAVPSGIFLIAFLAALADCVYAHLFPTPLPTYPDESF